VVYRRPLGQGKGTKNRAPSLLATNVFLVDRFQKGRSQISETFETAEGLPGSAFVTLMKLDRATSQGTFVFNTAWFYLLLRRELNISTFPCAKIPCFNVSHCDMN
jgi:hypothetical protein